MKYFKGTSKNPTSALCKIRKVLIYYSKLLLFEFTSLEFGVFRDALKIRQNEVDRITIFLR